jgi:hypothetical protein
LATGPSEQLECIALYANTGPSQIVCSSNPYPRLILKCHLTSLVLPFLGHLSCREFSGGHPYHIRTIARPPMAHFILRLPLNQIVLGLHQIRLGSRQRANYPDWYYKTWKAWPDRRWLSLSLPGEEAATGFIPYLLYPSFGVVIHLESQVQTNSPDCLTELISSSFLFAYSTRGKTHILDNFRYSKVTRILIGRTRWPTLIFSSYKLCERHMNLFSIVQHHDDVVDNKHQSMHRKHRVNGCNVVSI